MGIWNWELGIENQELGIRNWEEFKQLNALEGLLKIKNAMAFLTKNRIIGDANNFHGIMVMLVN